jgi:hypothetical protein
LGEKLLKSEDGVSDLLEVEEEISKKGEDRYKNLIFP